MSLQFSRVLITPACISGVLAVCHFPPGTSKWHMIYTA